MELKCTRIVEVDIVNERGEKVYVAHELCGEPAKEYEFGGLLTKAKAVLCPRHREAAARQSWISTHGYDFTHAVRGYKRDLQDNGPHVHKPELTPGCGLLDAQEAPPEGAEAPSTGS